MFSFARNPMHVSQNECMLKRGHKKVEEWRDFQLDLLLLLALRNVDRSRAWPPSLPQERLLRLRAFFFVFERSSSPSPLLPLSLSLSLSLSHFLITQTLDVLIFKRDHIEQGSC
jgi:hypothetical protein